VVVLAHAERQTVCLAVTLAHVARQRARCGDMADIPAVVLPHGERRHDRRHPDVAHTGADGRMGRPQLAGLQVAAIAR
jgi:hypothetical protein